MYSSVIKEFSLYLFLLIKNLHLSNSYFNHFIFFKHSVAAFCSASFFDFPDEIKYFVTGSFTPTLNIGLWRGPVFEINLYEGSFLNFLN